MVFLERSQIDPQREETDHLQVHFLAHSTRAQGPDNIKAWAKSEMVKRAVTAFLANPVLTDDNTYKITKCKGIHLVEFPPLNKEDPSPPPPASRGHGGEASTGAAGGRGLKMVLAAAGAAAAGAAAAAPAAAAAAGASSAPAPGASTAAVAAAAARHSLAKKQQQQQAETEKLQKTIASLSLTSR